MCGRERSVEGRLSWSASKYGSNLFPSLFEQLMRMSTFGMCPLRVTPAICERGKVRITCG
jgi:hypothetical protein